MGVFDDVQNRAEGKGQIGGPVSGFTPTAAYNSPAAALVKGIEGGVDLGIEIHKDNVTKEFSADLEAAEDKYFTKEGVTSEKELAYVGSVRSQLDKLTAAKEQKKMSTAEWRMRTESLLKAAINANPSVAAELRQAAVNILGYNPIGEAIRQQGAAESSFASQKKILRDGVLKLINKYGLTDLTISEDENISAYGALALRITKSRDEADRLQAVAVQAGVWDVKNQGKAANQYVGSASARITSEILEIIRSDSSIEEKRFAINSIKENEGSYMSQKFPDLSVSTLQSLRGTYQGTFDLANSVIDGSANLKDMETSMKSQLLVAQAGILKRDGATEMFALIDLAKGQPLPLSVRLKMANFLQDAGDADPSTLAKLSVDLTTQTGSTSPYDLTADLGLGKEGTDEWHKAVTNYNVTFAKNADVKNPQHVSHFEKIIKGTLVKRFNNMAPTERDGILKIASSPKFVDFMKEINDPELTDRVRDLTARYMTTLTKDFFKAAFEKADGSPDEGDSDSNFTLLERFLGSDSRKLVTLEPQPDGSVLFKPTAGIRGDKLVAANELIPDLNGGYAVRINDAIKTAAHVQGHTNYKAMRDITLRGMPEFEFFMDDAKNGNSNKNDQGTNPTNSTVVPNNTVDFRDL